MQHTRTTVFQNTKTEQLQCCSIQELRCFSIRRLRNYSFAAHENSDVSDGSGRPSDRSLNNGATTHHGGRTINRGGAQSGNGPSDHIILVILVEYRRHELLYNDVKESMGPNKLDCPMPEPGDRKSHRGQQYEKGVPNVCRSSISTERGRGFGCRGRRAPENRKEGIRR